MGNGKDQRLIRKVRMSYIVSTTSITLVLFMLGVVSYITFAAISAANRLKENVVVSVEIADELYEEQCFTILSSIEATGYCANIEMLSKDMKLKDEEFRRNFELDIDGIFSENPLRDSYEITLKSEYSNSETVDAFKQLVSSLDGVEYISSPPLDVLDNMHHTIQHITLALIIFLGVLLAISVLLLNNTIRLAIYSKRYLINTMKLVGATKWYIMRPLLASALKQGVIAGVVATLLVCLAVYGVEVFSPAGLSLLPYREVSIILVAMLLLGILITLLFSATVVNKLVNMKTNKIHLY